MIKLSYNNLFIVVFIFLTIAIGAYVLHNSSDVNYRGQDMARDMYDDNSWTW